MPFRINSEAHSLTAVSTGAYHLGVVGVVGSNPAAPMSDDSTPVVNRGPKGPFLLVICTGYV